MRYSEAASPESSEPQKSADGSKTARGGATLGGTFIAIGTVWLVAVLLAVGAYATGHRGIATIGIFAAVTMMFA